MGKGKKRRRDDKSRSSSSSIRNSDNVNFLSNITGLAGIEGNNNVESLDDCLAELQQQSTFQATTASLSEEEDEQKTIVISNDKINHEKDKSNSSSSSSLKNKKASSTTTSNDDNEQILKLIQMNREQIETWNRNFVTWVNNNSYTPGLIPCVDEELARNFKIKELSTFLLESADGIKDCIRMPVFERWLIDSKFQEQYHQSGQQQDEDDEFDNDDDNNNNHFNTIYQNKKKRRKLLKKKKKQRNNNNTNSTSLDNDPILPMNILPTSDSSQRLIDELCYCYSKNKLTSHLGRNDAIRIVADLCRRTNVISQELSSQIQRYRKQSPLKKGDRIEYEEQRDTNTTNESESSSTSTAATTTISLLYSRKKWRKPFCFKLNKSHYIKLKQRFLQIHNHKSVRTKIVLPDPILKNSNSSSKNNKIYSKNNNEKATHTFHLLLIGLLLRYSALSGGHLLQELRGGGMQGAIHEQVFDALQCTMHDESNSENTTTWLEGFASPFNSYLPLFTSAFPDIEWHFGSIGNFMDTKVITLSPYNNNNIKITSNNDDRNRQSFCCEVNPPFSPGLMDGMVTNMINQLIRANEEDISLSFVVIVPTVQKTFSSSSSSSSTTKMIEMMTAVKRSASKSFHRMLSSRYCRHHLILSASEHGYVEGAQHLRPTRYKESMYDTSVILLQSDMATTTTTTGLDSSKLDKELKLAFASRHKEELDQRRRKTNN